MLCYVIGKISCYDGPAVSSHVAADVVSQVTLCFIRGKGCRSAHNGPAIVRLQEVQGSFLM